MRTDNTHELAEHAIAYIRSLCFESNHSSVMVFTAVKEKIDIELNRMAGLDPDRNK